MRIELELSDLEVNRILNLDKGPSLDFDGEAVIVRAYIGASNSIMDRVRAIVKSQSNP